MESSLGIGILLGVFASLVAAVVVVVIFAARQAHTKSMREKDRDVETRPLAGSVPQAGADAATRVLPQQPAASATDAMHVRDTVVLPRAATKPRPRDAEPTGNTVIVEAMESRDKQFAASVQEVRDLLLNLAELITRTESASGKAEDAFNSARASVRSLQSAPAPEILEARSLLVSEIDRVLASNAALHSELEIANRGIAEQEKLIEELRVQARIDALTRIPNRAAFDERLSEYVSLLRRKGLTFSLLILDIDRFKNVNDEHGHISGDRILRGIATKLSDSIRDNDFVARYGGEEFAVIFPGTNLHDALPVAERIRAEIAKTNFRMDMKTLKITISGGLAECAATMTPVQIISAADAALYQAKSAGRNRVFSTENSVQSA